MVANYASRNDKKYATRPAGFGKRSAYTEYNEVEQAALVFYEAGGFNLRARFARNIEDDLRPKHREESSRAMKTVLWERGARYIKVLQGED